MTNQKNSTPETITIPIDDYKVLIETVKSLSKRVEELEKSGDTKGKKSSKSEPDQAKSTSRKWTEKTLSATRDGKGVSYAWEDGSYVYDKGVRLYVNNIIKDAGGVWDADAKKYMLSSAQKATVLAKKLNGFVVEVAKVDEFMQARKSK